MWTTGRLIKGRGRILGPVKVWSQQSGSGVPLRQMQVLLGLELLQFRRPALRKEIKDYKYQIYNPSEHLFRMRKEVMMNHKFYLTS